MKPSERIMHPGKYVRKNIIPANVTVTAAAKLLGIGRPALSNFLNGNSALSADMAERLEKAFCADPKRLLDMQAEFDRVERLSAGEVIVVRSFVPNFLTIKSLQIEAWADQINARSLLPVLLRKLIHSTGTDLRQVDFPGYDNAQRKGSDGIVVTDSATPWIPVGKSFWEFGTNKKPEDKANKDYVARLTKVSTDERKKSTFVFVTPRQWDGKLAWEKQKNGTGDWKAVRVFDSSDLEQWLEQSVPAQIWLANQLNLPGDGFETLEQAWSRWANVSEPHMTTTIFSSAIAAYKETFISWLEKPCEEAFCIAADSKDEALAFLACLFEEPELLRFKDIAAVFTTPETLKGLIASSISFIPIVFSTNTERELVDAEKRLHCVVCHPRNMISDKANIILELLNYDTFKKALITMGIDEGDVDTYARSSGRSPTILRRLLSGNSAIKKPEWADNDTFAKALVPMALIGVWHDGTEADKNIVSHVAKREYEEIEKDIALLLTKDDSPVWSVGTYRGVASKIDSLFSVAPMVTLPDIDRFFIAAENVLSEIDPSLELNERDRWAAALYKKTRNHSKELRNAICETLVILSVHGNDLFQSRMGLDIESKVNTLIKKLLTPLSIDKLLSHKHDLPLYAEAAPDVFLSLIEDDLKQDNPIVLGLLKPGDSSVFFASPTRSGLLWALECLAWNTKYLMRVSLVLARLSEVKIDDNWANKPESSLEAVFRAWMPQTAASVEIRIKVFELLAQRYPDIVWRICIEQIKPGSKIGHNSYRPHWRSDASGAGQVATNSETNSFLRKILDLAISWPLHNAKTLGDLVESLKNIPLEDIDKVWNIIEKWATDANEDDKATLRERIRLFAFTRMGYRRKLNAPTRDYARKAYEILEPADLVIRHGWLFHDYWVQESISEIEDENFDFKKHDERIDKLRREAIGEIWGKHGFAGIRRLFSNSDAAKLVGRYTATCNMDMPQQIAFVMDCLNIDGGQKSKAEECLQGFLLIIEDEARKKLLMTMTIELPLESRTRIFACAPFKPSTWRILDDYEDEIQAEYWKKVVPTWSEFTPSETTELIDGLLEARRPRAAFSAVKLDLKNVETSRLKRLLVEVATVNSEPLGNFGLDIYRISEALDELNSRDRVSCDEMAQLEFLLIQVLEDSEHGIPNLEKQIAESPGLFVQVLALVYKRSDNGQDPVEWKIENSEQKEAAAMAAHSLLRQIKKIPGTDDTGKIDSEKLFRWLIEVRQLCREYSRSVIGDHCIGQILSRASVVENGTWPCEAVCEVMERVASQEIGRGFAIGVYNSRGVFSRDKGGSQELEIAARYHRWAEQLQFTYPFVGGVLENIADSYKRDARMFDTEDSISKRLHG